MTTLQIKIAASRAASPARFKLGKPVAPLAAPYFNVWNCPVGRAQKVPQGNSAVAAIEVGSHEFQPLPF